MKEERSFQDFKLCSKGSATHYQTFHTSNVLKESYSILLKSYGVVELACEGFLQPFHKAAGDFQHLHDLKPGAIHP